MTATKKTFSEYRVVESCVSNIGFNGPTFNVLRGIDVVATIYDKQAALDYAAKMNASQ